MFDEDVPSRPPGLDVLSQTVISNDANLQAALRRVAETGRGLVTHCSAASVTLVELGRPITVGSTNDTAGALDAAQYEARAGPCLAAAQEQRVVRIDDTINDERWPKFSASARAHGIRSSLSVPLALSGDDTVGGLNMYGDIVAGFSASDEAVAQIFATHASITVSNAQAYWAVFELSQNLDKAMQSRAVIEQAKGALMSTHRIDADAAFELLRNRSQTSNRKLRDVAREVISELSETGTDASPR
jgi:GAF domain-containing protein